MKRVLIIFFMLAVITIAFIQDRADKNEFLGQAPDSLHPTGLTIERKGILQRVGKQPPSRYHIENPQLTDQIYNAFRSFKSVQPNVTVSCPVDYGISYDMYFYENEKIVFLVHVEAGGCQFAHFKDGRSVWTNDSFWKLMQLATGMNAMQLRGVPASF